MFRRRRRRISAQGNEDPPLLMTLSLFIMLLAFFIVLNAISSYEEDRTFPVVESLQLTFAINPIKPDIEPAIVPDTQQSFRDGETIERIDALFNAQITSFDAVRNETYGMMEVTLPIDVFAAAVMAIGQEDMMTASPDAVVKGKKFFLPTLVSILKSDQQGVPYRMDVMLHINDNPALIQNREPQALEQVLDRGAQLTAQLEKAGLPQKLLSIGIGKGDPGKVRILFRPHEPFTPVDPKKGETP